MDRIPLHGPEVFGPVTFVIPEECASISTRLMLLVKCVAGLGLAIRWFIHASEKYTGELSSKIFNLVSTDSVADFKTPWKNFDLPKFVGKSNQSR